MWYYGIALIVFLLDQGTKWIIANRMELHQEISVIGDFFIITSHRNRGAAFGILQEQRWFFIVVTIVVVAGLVWYLQKIRREPGRILPFGLALILGGAVGNFLDRLLFGEVVDFLMFNFGSYTFPIFNVADSAICIGVGFVLLDTILSIRNEKLSEQQEGK
ncbi:signal peptidase II [Paenibacillus aquistagni]|uniref:Lipoprotein signal peptidase n=1 Tax=Paenibacillus aquistagni TaxID=1852522 RepID=A0A1X7IFW7_9BACL|nr:signal peptidase II [Paenibacillus aquistagni]NMM51440.1 signal peptidase II [Paenibacillus aquistagni]SMG13676.1 signal peptidase II [Paenibacillus aquistagni]